MIGKLKGVIDSYGPDWVILDVQGVGYLVHCSNHTLQELPSAGEAAMIAIETYVREQEIRLFGFTGDVERQWFRLLLTVQGVGTRVALAILSTLKPGDLASAIALQDKAMAEARSAGFSVPRMASATRVPTPCTVKSSRNHSRSTSSAKPKSRISCSRT